jgi:hypothetical protein
MLQQKFLILDAPVFWAHAVQATSEPAPLLVDAGGGAILENVGALRAILDRAWAGAHGQIHIFFAHKPLPA